MILVIVIIIDHRHHLGDMNLLWIEGQEVGWVLSGSGRSKRENSGNIIHKESKRQAQFKIVMSGQFLIAPFEY